MIFNRCTGGTVVCFEGDCQAGYGKAGYTPAALYLGNFQQGVPAERGIALLTDGSFFDGRWESGLPNGPGSLMLPDGSYFLGNFLNGFPEGKGLLVQAGPITYSIIGRFQAGRLTGSYLLTNEKTKEICKGIAANGRPVGHCSIVMNSLNALRVDRYRELHQRQPGMLRDCCVDGKERMISKNGVEYIGDTHNYLPMGSGEAINKHKSIFTGNWEEGKPHGTGRILFSDGSSFLGFFVNGLPDGAGLLVDKAQTKLLLGKWKAGTLEGLYRLKQGTDRECYGHAISGQFESSCTSEEIHPRAEWLFDFN